MYRFLDENGVILYVGKAKNLKKRVSSYFNKKKFESGKLKVLTRKTDSIRVTVVPTETDALLLENSLIKENQPRYNVNLKDGKTYPFICIKKERFPRIFLTRKRIDDGSEYLGPYTSVKVVRSIMHFVRSVYPMRNCSFNLSEKNIAAGKFKVCLEKHLGNCLGPCEGLQEEQDYIVQVKAIRKILNGHTSEVVKEMEKEMTRLSEKLEFEKAEELKSRLDKVRHFQKKTTVVSSTIKEADVFAITEWKSKACVNFIQLINGAIIKTRILELTKGLDEDLDTLLRTAILHFQETGDATSKEYILPFEIEGLDSGVKQSIPKAGDKKKLLDMALGNALQFKKQKQLVSSHQRGQSATERKLETLKEDFRLTELPHHIECFDNSNIQGSSPVASMVVFRNAKAAKKEYRHYNIKTVEGPDDFASMEEVVFRRYKKLRDEGLSLPQLVIIDGGKGQLSSAMKAIDRLGLNGKMAIAGIAKKLEEIYFPNDSAPLYIDKKSESLRIIQQLRNEAHRFAITFHRKKRSQKMTASVLDNIPGIGPKSITALLKAFQSPKGVSEASLEGLIEVVGKDKATKVRSFFREQGA